MRGKRCCKLLLGRWRFIQSLIDNNDNDDSNNVSRAGLGFANNYDSENIAHHDGDRAGC